MEKKKESIATIVVIVLLALGLISTSGYIVYDKVLSKDVKEESKEGETKEIKDEKLANELESLIVANDSKSLHSLKKITIDTISSNKILVFALEEYAKDKNIKFEQTIYSYYNEDGTLAEPKVDEENNLTKENGKEYISKKDLDSYIKKTFNTNKVFDFELGPDSIVGVQLNSGHAIYNSSDDTIYFGKVPMGGSRITIKTKVLKIEQKGEEIYLYDKAARSFEYSDGGYTFEEAYDNAPEIYSCNNLETMNDQCNTNIDQLFEKYYDELVTYKHTFKQDKDGNYYWYSSELFEQ